MKHKFSKYFILLYFSLASQSCAFLKMSFHDKFAAEQRAHLSTETIYVDVKFRAQSQPELCGVASMHMLIDYYKTLFSDSIREELIHLAQEQNGLTGLQIKQAFLCAGYSTYILKGDLSDEISGIKYHLKKSHPLLVMLKSDSRNINHMVLVVGLDPTQHKVVVLDPTEGQTLLKEDYFNKIWQQANNFMLIAIPDLGVSCENTK